MNNTVPISIVIPTFNEGKTIIPCIESLLQGDYPTQKIEFIIADGGSTDQTWKKIEEFKNKRADIRIKILHNPHRTQGYGLNIAIRNADPKTEYIVRIDAHSLYPAHYLRDCLEVAQRTNADNVGSTMIPISESAFQSAVAYCMSHPLGVGNAKYHLGNFEGHVDTAYLGCFKKEILDRLDGFDPTMTPNEDAELNLRIKRAGGTVYLSSKLQVEYYPRNSLKKLILQYFRYGQGRCRTVKKHKQFTSFRQIIPPFWFLATFLLLILSSLSKFFLAPLIFYLFVNLFVSIHAAFKKRNAALLLCSICFIGMHYSWGLGFLTEIFRTRGSSLWAPKPQFNL